MQDLIKNGERNLIKIDTFPYGEIEIDENDVIDFKNGILGYDFIKKFVILKGEGEGEDNPFIWLQSTGEKYYRWVLMNIRGLLDEYNIHVSKDDMQEYDYLFKSDICQMDLFSIAVLPDNPYEMTVNLKGPIVINRAEKQGAQIVNISDEYSVKDEILPLVFKKSNKDCLIKLVKV